MENDSEKFWRRVRKTDTCWIWTGPTNRAGYGTHGSAYAHRLAYELVIGPIPAGFVLDHVRERGCQSKACVNPAHLEPVTRAENTRRGRLEADRDWRAFDATHCRCGRDFAAFGKVERRAGRARCRVCHSTRLCLPFARPPPPT